MTTFAPETLLALLLLGAPALAQNTLYRFEGDAAGFGSSMRVAPVGQVDADGIPDFAVASPGLFGAPERLRVLSGADGAVRLDLAGSGTEQLGRALAPFGDANGDGADDLLVALAIAVRVVSASDGATLLQIDSPNPPPISWARAISGLGDVNGDGSLDFAVGTPERFIKVMGDVITGSIGGPGYVEIVSGATGQVLHTLTGDASGDAFGGSLARLADVDGDGIDDLAVGCSYHPAFTGGSYVRVVSGATGQVLLTAGNATTGFLGGELTAPGDLDGDGTADFVVGLAPTVTAVSVATGAVIWRVQHAAFADRWGESLGAAGDVDGDGTGDVVVGAPQPTPAAGPFGPPPAAVGPGFVEVLSGATGSLLAHLDGDALGREFGASVCGLSDVNADGVPDLGVVAALEDGAAGLAAGAAYVVSPTPLTMVSNGHAVSLAAGGTQTLSIDAGPGFGAKMGLLVGSASGIAPGFFVDGLEVDLVIDPYTLLLLVSPASIPISSVLLTLDAAGTGSIDFTVPAGTTPALAGASLHHAFAVFDLPGTGQVVHVTPSVPLLFRL